LSISIRSSPHGTSILEGIVESKIKPVLAKAIQTTPEALIVVMESGTVSIPWDRCSERLARASQAERDRAELSPSGYGIHWSLIDEDLAVGPLVQRAA
jgi:hypothetical protein